jgi:hypothetical protein
MTLLTKIQLAFNYFFRSKVNGITYKEFARVNSLKENSARNLVYKLKKQGKITVVGKRGRYNLYSIKEEVTEYVKKYLSSILYCGVNNSHHGKRKNAYAFTFEPAKDKNINRSDDLYEEIKKHSSNCYELDIDELDGMGKKYGYGVEPVNKIDPSYLYPKIAVRIDGVKIQ